MATAAATSISETALATTTGARLLSLDVFRGLTILAMILVNNPGKWGERYQYWPLEHAVWHGWTPTDLIFPFFLFIVGTALAYSLRKYRDGASISSAVYWRIIRRTLLLIFLGWLPGLLFRAIGYVNGDASALDLSTFRIFGVLVRIALVYFCASLIVLHINIVGQIALAIGVLLGYWALLAWLPNPHDFTTNLTNDGNVVGLVDRALVGLDHMYRAGGATDPEGLLSTLPAVVTALFGYWTGLFIQRRGVNCRTVAILIACGLALAAVGQGWHYIFPINKKIWTSSFVLLTGGLAMAALGVCLVIFDIWNYRRLGRPFEIVGINAIFVFVASGLVATALGRIKIGSESAHDWLFHTFFTAHISDPKLASLLMALATVAFWWFICWIMSRLGWAIRV
jgi:predicted acyltransferase